MRNTTANSNHTAPISHLANSVLLCMYLYRAVRNPTIPKLAIISVQRTAT